MRTLYLYTFVAGFATLGMELSASRLLEPVFGNSQLVWAALIGLILLYLAVGGWLGGWLADRYPHQRVLALTLTLAAIGLLLIPTLSAPVLGMAATGFDNFAIDLLAGSLVAILLLFSLPGILLGTVSPWAVRLALTNLQSDRPTTGRVTGRLYAIGTLGSLAGTFLPVLWLIPTYGTRRTFYLLAIVVLIPVLIPGLFTVLIRGSRWAWPTLVCWLAAVALLVSLLLLSTTQPGSGLRSSKDTSRNGQIIYEEESLYNYIAVRQWGNERHLKLNDGIGIHSVYHPDALLSQGIWDYFLLAPFFTPPFTPTSQTQIQNLLLIGLAAGTVSELYTTIYGPLPITGVELDPAIIGVGQRYFAMNQPNLQAIAGDGRRWLSQQPPTARWDVVAIDAYRPPYIPFHLTTVEFFRLVRTHLGDHGVVAINVGRTTSNFALVDALAATLAQVFPTVYAIDEPGPADNLGNSLLVATVQPTILANYITNIATITEKLPHNFPTEFQQFANASLKHVRIVLPEQDTTIFYDDHAPVERLIHTIILNFIQRK